MDKYYYYHNSVQSPSDEIDFFYQAFRELRQSVPTTLCEDFSGTFAISCEWVKKAKANRAVSVDLEVEPLEYGKKHYLAELSADEKERLVVIQDNVLNHDLPKTQIIAGLNFSYFIFKEREKLKDYFKSSWHRLEKDGIFVLDCFGGRNQMEPNVEETEHDGYSYFWDQDTFDPVTNHSIFHIHFDIKGDKRYDKVFTYDWRMWSIPEIRDVLADAGFSSTHVFWEGSDEKGEGNGVFTNVSSMPDDCDGWLAYIVATK